MASFNQLNTSFRLIYQAGLDQNGKQAFKAKSYNNVKTSSTDDQIFQAALAISSLCNLPLATVERDDTKEIFE